jgi:hypothetical protein
MSLFCRHNRFMADCPICSKGTVLETPRRTRRPSQPGSGRRAAAGEAKPAFSGPNEATRAYEDEDGERYVVRLERVPGGVRLAEWSGSKLRRRAPVLDAEDLAGLIGRAGGVLSSSDATALGEALATEAADGGGDPGVSKGRSGDFKEELRVERLEDGRVRVGRWVLRPNQGWQLQEAAPMLPAKRYAEAIAGAARNGLLAAP